MSFAIGLVPLPYKLYALTPGKNPEYPGITVFLG